MGTWEDIDDHKYTTFLREVDLEIHSLRDKLWKEDKIRIDGYTYSEWKKEQESRVKK